MNELRSARIIVSKCRNPWWNLSLEDYVFRHCFDAPFLPKLVLYVNDPCVVVGRNQNPWREANIPLLKSLGIPLVRRRSGGGTVVHDSGNINFSVLMPRKQFSRDKHGLMICSGLNSWDPASSKIVYDIPTESSLANETESQVNGWIDIDTSSAVVPDQPVLGPQCTLALNERYDILAKETGKKVSGSAYKIERERAYHHGTMLLNSRLDVLRALLHRDASRLGRVEGRGTDSVKSPVANISCDTGVFVTSIIRAFQDLYEEPVEEDALAPSTSFSPLYVGPEDLSHVDQISNGVKELESWDWTYGQTPKFSHELVHPETDSKLTFHVEKGRIQTIEGVASMDLEPGHHKYTGAELAHILPPQSQWVCGLIDGHDA